MDRSFLSRVFAAISLVSLAACETTTTAPTPGPAPISTASASCIDLAAPRASGAADALDLARRCESVADNDTNLRVRERGVAYYHAGRAYLDAASMSSGQPSIEPLQASVALLRASFDNLQNTDGWLNTVPETLRTVRSEAERERAIRAWTAQTQAFRLDRVLAYATALTSLSETVETARLDPRRATCTRRETCLSLAIDRMSQDRQVAQPYARLEDGTRGEQYDRFHLLLGDLHRARDGALDGQDAIDAYETVVNSPINGPLKADARERLESYAVELADTALAEDGNERGAIQLYTRALAANRQSARALSGLGNAHLRLGTDDEDAALLRQAEEYFSRALAADTEPLAQAAAFRGRAGTWEALASIGDARDITGGLDPFDRALLDYEQAASLSGEAEDLLGWASACERKRDWACAADKFNQAVAQLRADPEASPNALSDALLRQASAADAAGRNPDEVRDILLAARAETPRSAKPVLKLAGHQFKHGDETAAAATLAALTGSNATQTFVDAPTFQAEAYSLLSSVNALSNRFSTAVENADRAADLRRSDESYTRIACLARIRAGGRWTNDSDEPRCSLGTSPDELLLQAMFQMRRAQRLSVSGARAARQIARSNLDFALSTVTDEDVTDFDWPRAETLPPVGTEKILIYLKEASLACNGDYDFNLPDDGRDYRDVQNFLNTYSARLCTP
ncbi:MAG: hypothetical protein AAF253_04225 [Pseudomonadota bacterium]